jgi:hypothetical protein
MNGIFKGKEVLIMRRMEFWRKSNFPANHNVKLFLEQSSAVTGWSEPHRWRSCSIFDSAASAGLRSTVHMFAASTNYYVPA